MIWNQSINDTLLETNMVTFLTTLKKCRSPLIIIKKTLFRYSGKIYIVSLTIEMVQYHFTIENIFIHI